MVLLQPKNPGDSDRDKKHRGRIKETRLVTQEEARFWSCFNFAVDFQWKGRP